MITTWGCYKIRSHTLQQKSLQQKIGGPSQHGSSAPGLGLTSAKALLQPSDICTDLRGGRPPVSTLLFSLTMRKSQHRLLNSLVPHVTQLTLHCSKLSDLCISQLTRAAWPKLAKLDSSGNQLDEAAIGALSQGKWLKLNSLNLGSFIGSGCSCYAPQSSKLGMSKQAKLGIDKAGQLVY